MSIIDDVKVYQDWGPEGYCFKKTGDVKNTSLFAQLPLVQHQAVVDLGNGRTQTVYTYSRGQSGKRYGTMEALHAGEAVDKEDEWR